MIELTSVLQHGLNAKMLDVEFILFRKIACSVTIENKFLLSWDEIKIHIENQLTEDFNKNK